MANAIEKKISPRVSLISAFLVHAFVEVPYFIFPVIILVVGDDLFQDTGVFMWIGLGSLGTIGTLAAGLPSPVFGYLSDKYRRGSMMVFSLVLGAFGSLIIGIFGTSFLGMTIGIVVIGLGIALYHPPGLSWVSSAFEDPERQLNSSNFNRILGIHGVGGTIGASIAPISIFFLIDTINWRQIYFLWSIPLIILAIFFWLFVARHEPSVEYSSPHLRYDNTTDTIISWKDDINSTVLTIFVFMFAMSLTWGMISFILSPFLSEVKQFKVSQAALFIGFSHLLAASGQMIGGILGDKYGEKIALSFAAVLQVVVLIGIYVIDSSLILFVLYVLIGVVNAIFWPSTNSLLAKSTRHRGSAFGGFMLIVNVVRSIGPSIDGVLMVMDPNSYLLIFVFAIFFSIAAFFSLIFVKNAKDC